MDEFVNMCLNEYRECFPKRHIILMDESATLDFIDERFRQGYLSFNLEIISTMLPLTSLDFELRDDGVLIKSDEPYTLFRSLLWDARGVGCIVDGGVLLSARVSVCDLMRVVCALVEKYKI